MDETNWPGEVNVIPENTIDGKPLGRHLHHDPRSRGYQAPVAGLPPQTRRWKRHVHAFDQHDIGSCTGNAIIGMAATDPVWTKGMHYTERAAVRCYKIATTLDPWEETYPPDDTGSTGLAACKAALQLGYGTKYLWGFGINDMIGILSHMGSCAVGVNWYEGFDYPNQEGLVYVDGELRGGHEFHVVGWHQDTSLGAPEPYVFEAVNSWGTGWGLKGRFYIRLADMDRLLHEDGDVVTLATDVLPA